MHLPLSLRRRAHGLSQTFVMRRSLSIALVLLAPVAVFVAFVWGGRAIGASSPNDDYVLRIELPPITGDVGLPIIEGPLDASRPLVVIDAGHGGHDPGAGDGAIDEKTLTLALARALRDELLSQGGVRVAMTRDSDRFLMLPERTGIARRLKADLFLSVHADSVEGGDASGASIYTLSERGTTEAAARMAERENRADQINGFNLQGTSDAISAILVDLSQREALGQSEEFARLIVREGRGRIAFRERPLESAAFAVLKSPDMPSVLFEAGYISNPADTTRLMSSEGRAAFAQVTGQAIRVYFARQSAL